MLTLRKLPATARCHPDPLLRFYFDQLRDHWPSHRWMGGLVMAFGVGESGRLGISSEERRLIHGRVQPEHYVSMSIRRGIHRLLNPGAIPIRANLLKDKAAFARFAETERLAAPLTLTSGPAADLMELGDVVLKPSFSSKGRGVVRARRGGSGWRLTTGERLHPADLELRIERLTAAGGVAQEGLRAHPLLADISPDALPTARVMTFRIGRQAPVKGLLVLRFGGGGAPVDNFNRGGLVAVPAADGGISIAWGKAAGRLVELNRHPATGASFARSLPSDLLVEASQLAVQAHLRLPADYAVVGWDIGLSERGPRLIEGNWNPGTALPQLSAGAGLSQMSLGALYHEALERVEPEQWEAAGALELDW
jgi:hypothetical protein